MIRARRFLFLVAVVAGVGGFGLFAWAFWSGDGAGAAEARVGSLAAPGTVGATVTGGSATVSVGWTDVAGPDEVSVDGYYLQRWSGTVASPACSSSPTALLAPGTAGCSDPSVPNGTYTYTVTAVFRSWTATSDASSPVTVDALARFVVSAPSSTTAGAAFSVTVTAQDAANTTLDGYVGTIHFTSSDPGPISLPGDYTFVPGDNDSHLFANGVTLTTTPAQTVTVADTSQPTKTGTASVSVSAGPAAQLGYTRQPGGGTGGTSWATQPKVAIQDAFGNTVTISTAPITLAITPGTGTPAAVLTCTTNPRAAVAGIATFSGCKIDQSGTSYTLTATADGLSTATSTTFDVAVGAAKKLVYSQQPTDVTAGATITPAVTVTVEDAGGNTVTTSTATITLAIGTNPGGGTLSGTLTIPAVGGAGTFADLSIDKTGTTYTLKATSTGLTPATSTTFTVSAGPAAQLGYTRQPGGGTGGTSWATQPKVAIQDAFGNTVTISTAPITLAITPGTGTPAAVLTCTTNPRAAVAGIATFSGCKIDQSGTSYTLTATADGLSTATSTTFDVAVGAAKKLVYSQQPTDVTAGATITPAVTVTVEDAGGNTVTTSTATITLAIGTNPGGGTLSGTLTIPAVGGAGTFADLSIDKTGTTYTLKATSTGLTTATSTTFTVR